MREVCLMCDGEKTHCFHESVEKCSSLMQGIAGARGGGPYECQSPGDHHDYIPGNVTLSQEEYQALKKEASNGV
jgi:hypothetical protein